MSVVFGNSAVVVSVAESFGNNILAGPHATDILPRAVIITNNIMPYNRSNSETIAYVTCKMPYCIIMKRYENIKTGTTITMIIRLEATIPSSSEWVLSSPPKKKSFEFCF